MSNSQKTPFAQIMREMTASAQYRRCKAEMQKMARNFSQVRHCFISYPTDQTIQMLRNEEFTVEKQEIKEYPYYKVSW